MHSVVLLSALIEATPCGTYLTTKDLSSKISSEAMARDLPALVKAGELLRVRKGLYYKGTKTRFGMTVPSSFDLATAVLAVSGTHSGFGPSGWSASAALGLSTQLPVRLEVAVPGRAPTPPSGIIFYQRSKYRLGLKVLEVAVLEVLRSWAYRIEADWDHLQQCATALYAADSVDIGEILRVAKLERTVKVKDVAEKLQRYI